MLAEILSTGDEIRSGAIVDGNSAHIAQALEEAGIEVVRHSCVGDDMEILVSVMKEIGKRSDIAVVTGGLGPTADDLTAEAAAKAAGVELVLDSAALGTIEDFFRALNRPVSPSNRKQAMLPKGAELLRNSIGTAPGFLFKIDRCLFFFLPGVPREMQRMLTDTVLFRIKKTMGREKEWGMVKTLSTFGMPESIVGEKLAGLTSEFPGIKVGLRANSPIIDVKLYARGQETEDLNRLMESACNRVVKEIGNRVFSIDGRPMEAVVGGLLREKKATIAVAESCTGGLLSNLLTEVPGSSDYFLFAGVTYSNEAKTKVLGVLPYTLKRYGAVHEETAMEMAEGARRIAGANYGLSTSGIAGPTGETDDKPVGTVCIGLSAPDYTKAFRFHFPFGNRSMKKRIFAVKALDLLRLELLGLSDG